MIFSAIFHTVFKSSWTHKIHFEIHDESVSLSPHTPTQYQSFDSVDTNVFILLKIARAHTKSDLNSCTFLQFPTILVWLWLKIIAHLCRLNSMNFSFSTSLLSSLFLFSFFAALCAIYLCHSTIFLSFIFTHFHSFRLQFHPLLSTKMLRIVFYWKEFVNFIKKWNRMILAPGKHAVKKSGEGITTTSRVGIIFQIIICQVILLHNSLGNGKNIDFSFFRAAPWNHRPEFVR